MAIDARGQNLALFTCGEAGSHPVRIYDVRRKTGRATSEIELHEFHRADDHDEVNCASFSPDGIFLAVGRSDNTLHVYDSRYLGRGPLYRFSHEDPNQGVAGKSYGVVEAQWIMGRDRCKLGLVSGGNDGCVRMWDVGVASGEYTNGKAVAEVAYDVAHFTLGDPFAGERGLVVGDSGGRVYEFDRLDGSGQAWDRDL
ncbi:hypothetical protein SERLA73DRAFT_191363 [Serpula lacrymans var. lacrymans S7.3]|uniref:Anaphase-promoting complex subunit 4 WD40 domain-containing protein n=2 Tax=Serpula lacrymans var. lacrymans TaxID=341189 RepID=F8QHD9_SERL3|nr:uncharacterized protein SERLADRAFT_472830 [Serpula lacrymans var. lacrymans S7.9]EGN92249.1 hypothetical protein SERLA73DRAFT_191363 [Serpula lacrymans var. lacrymans S7.3]EGO22262.1 hypothetical protein SERLADRAFT_472830 [Serpula lacrymans var. lacrymans S7.9]